MYNDLNANRNTKEEYRSLSLHEDEKEAAKETDCGGGGYLAIVVLQVRV